MCDNGNIVSKQFTTVHKNPEKSLAKMTELGYDYDSFYSFEKVLLTKKKKLRILYEIYHQI